MGEGSVLEKWESQPCSTVHERRTVVEGVKLRVVEMTGEPGDVILAHPMIVHAPAKNCSSMPRFALSATVFRTGIAAVKLSP